MSNWALLPGLLLVGAGIGWTVVHDRETTPTKAPTPTVLRQTPRYETGAALKLNRLDGLSACKQTTCAGCDLDFKSLVNQWGPPALKEEKEDPDARFLDLR